MGGRSAMYCDRGHHNTVGDHDRGTYRHGKKGRQGKVRIRVGEGRMRCREEGDEKKKEEGDEREKKKREKMSKKKR